MFNELRRFFLKKLRKENGVKRLYPQHVWWAVAYTWEQYRWLRIQRDPKRYDQWKKDVGER
jgi:hypothetical protein